jgi:hypothetical protein
MRILSTYRRRRRAITPQAERAEQTRARRNLIPEITGN